MGILRFIIRRLIFMVFLVIGVTIIIFAMVNAIGDPVEILLAERPGVTAEVIESVKQYYHLDESLPKQYISWLGNVMCLDFAPVLYTTSP